ncbi:helix-turn-helix domain-containing protein [Phenylobacterium sp.]|uniref:helix-turn-helix domain-containing protein n=1 Tax=Phenylobacterium sp. TaxID=1871053 RepID=UPI00286A8CA8|nr:helix-turn-helix domain-containing protein [Phenylobacterium sp.]
MTLTRSPSSAPVASLMDRIGLRMPFAKGEEIFGQADAADMIHGIVSGAVRTTRLHSDGRRQIGDFYYPGDIIGLETGGFYRFSAEALSDCVIHVVKRASLNSLSGDAGLDGTLWEATRRELERTQEHLLMLGRKSACEKVASFLMDVARRVGSEDVSLPMGRQDMADYLGLTIETVSRMVTQLQGSRIVEFASARQFRVTRWPALERLAA